MYQHVVPDPILTAIGDVTVSMSAAEQALGMLVCSMLADHLRIGKIVMAELPFRGMRVLLMSLYRERHGEDEDFVTLKRLMSEVAKLEEGRNQIMHSGWAESSIPNSVTRFKDDAKEPHGWRSRDTPVTESSIRDLARGFREIASSLGDFYFELIEAGKANRNPLEPIQWVSGNRPD